MSLLDCQVNMNKTDVACVLDDNETALLGSRFDQTPQELRAFTIIASNPRCGTHLLSRMLLKLGYGVPLEYFHPPLVKSLSGRLGLDATSPTFLNDYLSSIINIRTVNGYCTVTCMRWQWHRFLSATDGAAPLQGQSFIHLWRRDCLAQAISYRLSLQSGFWDFTSTPTTRPASDVDIWDLDALHDIHQREIMNELWWRAYLPRYGMPILHVAYEDLVNKREETLRSIVAHLEPGRAADIPPLLDEPDRPGALRARQSLLAEQRMELYHLYEKRFGSVTVLPNP
ncbi:MAG TPA: Stf0 family sulfotransferase [Rhodocyclaceae bacterium]|nr:Stf0 family sulfotransferase [Rhodocyclaceae bacterium]